MTEGDSCPGIPQRDQLNPPILYPKKKINAFTSNLRGKRSNLDLSLRQQVYKAKSGDLWMSPKTMRPEEALGHLRRKITMQMTGGSHGLMRCWILFRNRTGSSRDGISYPEFCRGLRAYGLPLTDAASRALFDHIDALGTGTIRIQAFIDNVMGRWASSSNSHLINAVSAGESASCRGTASARIVDEKVDDSLTMESTLLLLRNAIVQRLKSGPYGLQRCWFEFRQRAGSSKEGITFKEFDRGLRSYGILIRQELAEKVFAQMDVSNDGYIQIKEFIDHVMGRWTAQANTHYGAKSAEEVQGEAYLKVKAKLKQMVVEKPDEKLSIKDALALLRKNITQRLKSGPYGLMRCWFEFRLRAGSTLEGITLEEFARGLKCYGIPLSIERTRDLFKAMDVDGDGYIHMSEFVDSIMGRWAPSFNSGAVASTHLPAASQEPRRLERTCGSDVAFSLKADDAIQLLRTKIGQRISAGSPGLQTSWRTFRNAAGGTHAGVTYSALQRAFIRFGMPVHADVVSEIFARFDTGPDCLIHENEFMRIIMGRSSASSSYSDLRGDVQCPIDGQSSNIIDTIRCLPHFTSTTQQAKYPINWKTGPTQTEHFKGTNESGSSEPGCNQRGVKACAVKQEGNKFSGVRPSAGDSRQASTTNFFPTYSVHGPAEMLAVTRFCYGRH